MRIEKKTTFEVNATNVSFKEHCLQYNKNETAKNINVESIITVISKLIGLYKFRGLLFLLRVSPEYRPLSRMQNVER